jgi:pentose-5-phosphate-3-epimerase
VFEEGFSSKASIVSHAIVERADTAIEIDGGEVSITRSVIRNSNRGGFGTMVDGPP